MEVRAYTARCWREPPFWVVEVPGVGVTQGRGLAQVESVARHMIAVMTDAEPALIDVVVEPVLSDAERAEVTGAVTSRRAAERAAESARRRCRAAAYALHHRHHLPIKDVGVLLGLSHQRIYQLLAR